MKDVYFPAGDYSKELVEAALPPSGWIRDYVDFSSTLTDAPKVFHLAAAYAVLGSVLGRKVCTDNFGARDLYPNLWMVLVAPIVAFPFL